ncbi:hypothetical protein FRAHR75_1170002 [Frankia sp. Hr75.2]|nr:hypothetical protein FRAHR75_1170002 [Frankia sp. Hr75.2]
MSPQAHRSISITECSEHRVGCMSRLVRPRLRRRGCIPVDPGPLLRPAAADLTMRGPVEHRPMQFGILGPLEVRSATGETIGVGGPRPRALLVMLLLNAGRVVGVEQIVAGQYGDDPPAGAVGAVQAHVSRLRRSLTADLIVFQGAGYRLEADPEDVDVHRFDRLSRDGRRRLAAGGPRRRRRRAEGGVAAVARARSRRPAVRSGAGRPAERAAAGRARGSCRG